MLKFPIGPDDTDLILTPRWAELGANWQISLLALFILVPLGLILWLTRYELRLIARIHACGLLTLRLLLLVVLWVVVCLQPHFVAVHIEEIPTRLRIAVDLSPSMEVTDQQRRPAEKLRLARALRLRSEQEPPGDALVQEWIRQYEAGRTTVDWLAGSEIMRNDVQRKKISAERQLWHDATLAAVDALSRKAIIAKILSPEGLNLLERLSARHQVEIVGFHDQAAEFAPALLLDRLSAGKLREDSQATDLRQALANVTSQREQPLLGIVLFSDGQHNVAAPPFDLAQGLGKERIPIYPVLIGSRDPPNDVMLLDALVPIRAFKNTTIPIEIRSKVTNMLAQEMTIELQMGDKPARPEHRKTIQHQGKDDVYTVRMQAKMEEAGTHTLLIKVKSKDQKEITLANNHITRIVRVAEDKARVLLIDGDARWEYHYLANALLRDPTIQLERVVFSQPRIGMLKQGQGELPGTPKTKLPESKVGSKDIDPLMDFDCILLGDVAPEQLPVSDRQRLERYVAERGGTLIMIAGKRYLPIEYLRVNPKGDDPLVRLLPITEPQLLQKETGFTLNVTSEGKRQPFLQLEPGQATASWPPLPKHFWGIVGKRKPAATVLLTTVPKAETVVKEENETTGIMLQQNYGFGRVVFVGLESTWRWRYRSGDTLHHRFWGQLVRWSAADTMLPAGNRLVRYGSRDPVYTEGQEVDLAARLSDDLPPLKEPAQARAKIYRKKNAEVEEMVAMIPLSINPRQKNLLEAKVRDLPAGTYRMELDIPAYRELLAQMPEDAEARIKERDIFRILPRRQEEMLNLATNPQLLQTLAMQSDGKLYTPENVEQLLDRLSRRIERKEQRDTRKPWQDPPLVWWMLGLFLSLLTLEWGWRKWLELP